jgi:hypothetical protein
MAGAKPPASANTGTSPATAAVERILSTDVPAYSARVDCRIAGNVLVKVFPRYLE